MPVYVFQAAVLFWQDVDAADDVDRSATYDLRCFLKKLTNDDVEDDCQVHHDGEGKTIRKASLFAGGRLGTAGLRPQARVQAGVAPLLRDGEDRKARKVDNLVSSLGAFLFSALMEILMRKVGADGEE